MKRFYVEARFIVEASDSQDAASLVQNAVEALPAHYETEDVSGEPTEDDEDDT